MKKTITQAIEVVAIGNEILSGATLNTNTAYLSERLTMEGWEVHRHTALPDEPKLLIAGIQEALKRSSWVITTGGLGPTLDDITASSVSKLFKDPPQRISNLVGSAQGVIYPSLILLPGPPPEMQSMFEEGVLPYLRRVFPPQKKFFEVFHLTSLSEMEVDPLLRELKGVEAGIYPGYGILTVRLSSFEKAPLEAARKKIEEAFGSNIYPSKSGKIEEAIHAWFIKNHKTLALAESCTGGLMSAHLVSLAGASEYFLGSFITYSNALKKDILGVQAKEAVSKQAAREMLAGIFSATAADYGIAVSGIAGPGGGTPQKPVGTICYALGKRGEDPEIGEFLSEAKTRSIIILSTTNRLFGMLWRKIR